MNRRSVLLAFGTASVGLGGAFGSGAFSSVEATRTVDLNTSADSDAVLSFKPNNPSTVADNNIIATESVGGNDIIEIKQRALNEQATTRFEDTLKVTNGGSKNVGLSVNPDASDATDTNGNNLIGSVLDIEEGGNSIVDGSSPGDNAVNLDAGTSLTLTVVIDLRGSNSGSDLTSIDTIVFAARQADYSP